MGLGSTSDLDALYDDIAQRFAEVIDDYVKTSSDSVGNSCLGGSVSTLKGLFKTLFKNSTTAAYFATNFDLALTTYAAAILFSFSFVPLDGVFGTGVSNAVIPAPAGVAGALLAELGADYSPYANLDTYLSQKVSAISSIITGFVKSRTTLIAYFIPGTPLVPAVATLTVS